VDGAVFEVRGGRELVKDEPVALEHWVQLSLTEGIGPILANRLIEALGSAEAACAASVKQLSQIEGVGTKSAEAIHRSLREAQGLAGAEIAKAENLGVTLLSREDERYPVLLRSIPDPPMVLYVRGALEPRDLNGLAIVGSRRCSYYGREQAERFAALLAGAGFTIVSGGARGTDSAAHRGALSHPQGRTIAVLGCGVDVAYPPENKGLFEQIAAARGAVISEYPLETPPLADNFPRRNRIISGLSRGVLVTEAAERSGALITARQAADDHGRPVFALPGRVDNPMSAGPHQLLRDGAVLTAKLEDILDNVGPLPAEAHEVSLFSGDVEPAAKAPVDALETQQTPIGLSDRQRQILQQLAHDSMTVDLIIEASGLEAAVVLQELTYLTLKGLVKRVDGQTFARKR
jgi:DNA processing protein